MADRETRITSEGYSKYCKAFIPRSFLMVAMVGFMFGYDIGLTGCLTTNTSFLKEFFPNAYENLTKSRIYSFFNDDVLNSYRSSSYLLAFLSSSIVTAFHVPYYWQTFVCLIFLAGGVTMDNYVVPNISRLNICKNLFGFGLGVVIQLVYGHISRMTPCRYHGRVILWFQLAINVGILTPYFVYFVLSHPKIVYHWRESLFTLALPLFSLFGAFIVSHSVDDNIATIYSGSTSEQQVQIPWSGIIFRRIYWPSLVVVICISIFQQLTGVYAFMIYAPALFEAIGWGKRNSLLCSLIICGVNCLVTFFSFSFLDKFARRNLFIQGGFLMIASQIVITFIVGVQRDQGVIMPEWSAILLVVAMCGYSCGFAWSWGPLGWLLPCEILPVEIQSAGQKICVSMKMTFIFIVTRFFIVGFCKMMFYMCLLVLSLVIVMTAFVYIFLPETKDIDVENVFEVWKVHRHWKRYIEEQVDG